MDYAYLPNLTKAQTRRIRLNNILYHSFQTLQLGNSWRTCSVCCFLFACLLSRCIAVLRLHKMSNGSSAPTSVPASPLPQNSDDPNSEVFDIESITRLASTTIVLHPGSSHLRIGRASDPQPFLVPHVIAWRHKHPGDQKPIKKSLLSRERTEYADDYKVTQSEGYKQLNDAVQTYTGRSVCRWEQISKSNKKQKPETLVEGCGWNWTDTSQKQEFLIGDDALYIDEADCYDLQWPIVKGQLNVHDGSHGSLHSVMTNLEMHWIKSIETFLHIPRSELVGYRCLLLVPDIYIRQHVKALIHMLINNMGFSSILIHQESVCATYGCGIATACVVDVGHEKTSICCVEDGTSHKNTRICLDVGGRDITRVFAGFLKRNCLPYQKFDQDDRMDALLMEELKETFCHMEPDRVSPESQEFHIRRPGQCSLLYPIVLGDETLEAPLSIFFPKAFGLKMKDRHIHFATRNPGDSEDPMDEYYLLQTRSKNWENRLSRRTKTENLSTNTSNSALDENIEKMEDDNGEDLDDEETQQMCNYKPGAEMAPAPGGLLGLDQAIVWSVENCPLSYEDELKRRMYSCILVVGGGLAHFAGADQYLRHRIKLLIPNTPLKSLMVGQVDVVVKPKDQDPSIVAWKGGSVLSCLDNAQECWVTNSEWNKFGLKLLRERSPFIW
uniref:actin-related protein 8-like n=1 Tax=Styela clava TaxID=7725 RepID=UPI00193ACC0B|nr:actin-related protein 8-like [Styela clava]